MAIVGGGIARLSTAYILSRTGKSVAVLDDGYLGSGETGRTTAHITHALDDRYFNLEKTFGIKGAILAADSHTKAINFIETVGLEEKIDCDIVLSLFRHPLMVNSLRISFSILFPFNCRVNFFF